MGKKSADMPAVEPVEPTTMNEEEHGGGGEVDPELVDQLLEQAGERELLGEGGHRGSDHTSPDRDLP